jgi:hypothetical protein
VKYVATGHGPQALIAADASRRDVDYFCSERTRVQRISFSHFPLSFGHRGVMPRHERLVDTSRLPSK